LFVASLGHFCRPSVPKTPVAAFDAAALHSRICRFAIGADALLDTFEAERRAFALRLVQTTDRFFNVAAAECHLAEIIRTRVAPFVLPQMVKFEAAREYIFRAISQITLNYRGMGLDEGQAGPVHGGDRLPWVKMDGSDNYGRLSASAGRSMSMERSTTM
jgi:hypothetical protein